MKMRKKSDDNDCEILNKKSISIQKCTNQMTKISVCLFSLILDISNDPDFILSNPLHSKEFEIYIQMVYEKNQMDKSNP